MLTSVVAIVIYVIFSVAAFVIFTQGIERSAGWKEWVLRIGAMVGLILTMAYILVKVTS